MNKIRNRALSLLLTLCMVITALTGFGTTAFAESTSNLTITYSMYLSEITVTRKDSSKAEEVYYRTVNGSAVAGIHYTHTEGTMSFAVGEASKTVHVPEIASSNISGIYAFQNIYRTFYVQAVGNDGIVAQCTCSIGDITRYSINPNGFRVFYDTNYMTHEPDGAIAGFTITDDGFGQWRFMTSTDGFFQNFGVNARDYFSTGNTGAKLFCNITLEASEINDGYEYIQILADTPDEFDTGVNDGVPQWPNKSLYMAGFSINFDELTDKQYVFPVPNAGNDNSRISKPWNVDPYYNNGADLIKQRIKTGCYTDSTEFLILPAGTENIYARFDASGSGRDDWFVGYIQAHLFMSDNVGPVPKTAFAPEGEYHVGDEIRISVGFNEIVQTVVGPTIETNLGTFTYETGAKTNVISYKGVVKQEASTLTINKLGGEYADIKGNKVTDITVNLTDTINISAAVPYNVTVLNDGNGTASASSAAATFGTEITLSATPNSGYRFKEWQVVSGGVTVTDNKFTMPVNDVTVKAIFEKEISTIYSVEITWGAMEFTYSDGTWNPETHEYEGSGWTPDTSDGNKITVENTGNVGVNVSYAYSQINSDISGSFTDGANMITAPVPLAIGETKYAYLLLTGKPAEALDNVKLGTVTVTIGGE